MEPGKGNNVLLIGFMGSGKTSVGRELARMLGFHFVDTDDEIVRMAGGRSVPRIFEEDGEARFRDMETEALAALAGKDKLVISTGGGLPLREKNRDLMASAGFVIWLDATRQAILERVAGNANRPLLQEEDLEEKVHRMLEDRRPVYEQAADLRVETNGLSVADVAYGVAESIRVLIADQDNS
jgi:shikimate kinase